MASWAIRGPGIWMSESNRPGYGLTLLCRAFTHFPSTVRRLLRLPCVVLFAVDISMVF